MYSESFSFQSLSRNSKILLFSLGGLILALLIIILLVTHLPKVSADSVSIENYPSSFPEEYQPALEAKLLSILNLNANTKKGTATATIRESSIEETVVNQISYASFLIDLEAYKSTFRATLSWSDSVMISDNVFISCPELEESAFPDTPCSDNPGSSHNLSYYAILDAFPMSNSLYRVTYAYSGDDLVFTIDSSRTYLNTVVEKLRATSNSLADYRFTIKSPELTTFSPQSSSASDPLTFLQETYASTDCRVLKGNYEEDYYYTTITTGSSNTYNLINYKVVIKQSGSSWEVIASPAPILTIYNSPNVDREILNLANNL